MRISKKLIRKVAEELIREKGTFTQEEAHMRISEILERPLGVNEKKRITLVLRNEYVIKEIKRDRQNGDKRIYFFF